MHLATEAIVCAALPHGEHGTIARLLTPEDGLQPGYVRGGRSRRLRPVLLPGNIVAADYRARSETQLAALTVELVHSRAPLLAEPLPAAAIDWSTALVAAALPEGQPYPAIHAGLDGLLAAIEAAPAARGWAGGLVRFEALLLSALGYGGGVPGPIRGWPALFEALRATGDRLARDVLPDRRHAVLAARERLITRLRHAA
ncbi:DNA repair protein RecO [Sphingomonas jatrophae]|uniref:DNA replication and repair protein RecO n=1 Tax=Sphingomonas jatrophae TaxID=1166337 RepID=A0A1I6JK18_9SPHN|nr:recombination protein O N-terminal domain-containing protein [Sphingomonas jatrophae]SFR79376.1 DNA replication and repair protein RecO [Sphingomonas jatrophae]